MSTTASSSQSMSPATNCSQNSESDRFVVIVKRLLKAGAADRKKLNNVVVNEYLKSSPDSSSLIISLIKVCVESSFPDRLDVAINALSMLGYEFFQYAMDFLVDDIRNWHHLYSERTYEPDDDTWYIILRSVAQSEVSDDLKFKFISMISNATSRGMRESVLEALDDLGGDEAKDKIGTFLDDEDPFIANLAAMLLND